jgi:hypothetical protein
MRGAWQAAIKKKGDPAEKQDHLFAEEGEKLLLDLNLNLAIAKE